jgi:drug/metabolite transporter (DMT)-like permease
MPVQNTNRPDGLPIGSAPPATLSRGILAMALSAVAFSLMAALVKLAGPTIPNQELVALRSLASIAPIGALIAWRKVPLRVRRPGWLFIRGFLGYVAISCWFMSLNRLSLPDAVMIQYTSPVFVALMAPFFLKEKSRARDRRALVVALIGVAVVLRPGLGLTWAGASIGLAGALCSAGAYLTVRALRHDEHPFMVMLAFPAVASACAFSMVVIDGWRSTAGPAWTRPDAREWVLISGIALMTAIGQVFLTYGLQWESAGRATVATYVAVVASIPLGIVFFDQWPDAGMLLGGAMVIGSVVSLAVTRDAPVAAPAGAGAGQMGGALVSTETEPLAPIRSDV